MVDEETKKGLEIYDYFSLSGPESDKARFLKENLNKVVFLKDPNSDNSPFDLFRTYLLVQNPINTSDVNVAYQNPDEEKGRIMPIRRLRTINEVFIGNSNRVPSPQSYFRPKNIKDLENYDQKNALVRTSYGKGRVIYSPGILYKSERDSFYVYLGGSEKDRSVNKKSLDKLIVRE